MNPVWSRGCNLLHHAYIERCHSSALSPSSLWNHIFLPLLWLMSSFLSLSIFCSINYYLPQVESIMSRVIIRVHQPPSAPTSDHVFGRSPYTKPPSTDYCTHQFDVHKNAFVVRVCNEWTRKILKKQESTKWPWKIILCTPEKQEITQQQVHITWAF